MLLKPLVGIADVAVAVVVAAAVVTYQVFLFENFIGLK